MTKDAASAEEGVELQQPAAAAAAAAEYGNSSLLEFVQAEFEDLQPPPPPPSSSSRSFERGRLSKLRRRLPTPKTTLLTICCLAYAVYFCAAMYRERLRTEGSWRLLAVTCCCCLCCLLRLCGGRCCGCCCARVVESWTRRLRQLLRRHRRAATVASLLLPVAYCLAVAAAGAVARGERGNFVSVGGVCAILAVAWLLSRHPTRVNWRTVLGGLCIQITFAALLLMTRPGFEAFRFLGDRVLEFISHADAGSEFVFGKSFKDHFFVFSVLPVIIFFSSFIALLFHVGVLQIVIRQLGWVMQQAMGTTAAESLVAAANIFVGMMEAPLLIRPFVGRLTNSELHSVISCGYATIAGASMAAYIGMGVPAQHLLSACVMAAPGALALSKIVYPETKKSKTDSDSMKKLKICEYHNAVEAIGTGAINAIQLVAAIVVNLISFISMLTLLNRTLTWLGDRLCLESQLTFESLCGYLLWPVAMVIGVDPSDCYRVAELIGTKFFINEFVAYQRFNAYRRKFEQQLPLSNATGLEEMLISDRNLTAAGEMLERSVAITTYALCGFANIGSVGIQLAAFSVMLPRRKAEISPLVMRGVLTGTLTNLLTASIAGIFI